jgi:hypothetical protein
MTESCWFAVSFSLAVQFRDTARAEFVDSTSNNTLAT